MADLAVTAASVLASANSKQATGTAGATITAGQVLYQDPGDNMWLKLADNNGVGAVVKPVGIALHGAARGNPLTYVYEDPAFTPGGTLVVGSIYGLSDTAGGIFILITAGAVTTLYTAGMYANVLFIATTTTVATMKILSNTVPA